MTTKKRVTRQPGLPVDVRVGVLQVRWQGCGTKKGEVFATLAVGEVATGHLEGHKEATRELMVRIDVLREDLRLVRKKLLHLGL